MIDDIPTHGGQLRQISERFGIPVSQLTDFSANINPDGPSPAIVAALRASLEDASTLMAYPDLEEVELKRAIAAYAGVSPGNVAVANGFVPLLEAALRTLKIKRCLLPVPAFAEYRHSLSRLSIQVRPQVLTPNSIFCYDIDALLEGDHDAILIANPQNPSGVLTSHEKLLRLVFRCAERGIAVLLDEAFIDYAPAASLTKIASQNLKVIVFRSVTKFHGTPGLRVAYAVADETTARSLNHQLPPWPITTMASIAAVAALSDSNFEERTRLHNNLRESRLRAALTELGIYVYPSAANFLLLRLPVAINATVLWQRMIVEHHLVLRDCSNYEALPPGHLRLAIRTQKENERLIASIHLALKPLITSR